eukprot:Rhum_TRINITY_DN14144_c26_g1::Rhum_TRINITY_DN14144_c26_g1_i1::g.70875::m.70875
MEVFRWLFGRGESGVRHVAEVANATDEALVHSHESLDEIDKCVRSCEQALYTIESKEEALKEESEKLLMEAHDPASPAIPAEAQQALEHDVRAMLAHVQTSREDYETRILKLELKRASLLGEQRRAEEHMRDLGRTEAPIHGVSVEGIPEYPNLVSSDGGGGGGGGGGEEREG